MMLETLFSSTARVKLLKLLLLGPNQRPYLREMSALTGLAVRSVQTEMAKLVAAGVVVKEVSGRQTYYQINERCPIIPELRMMFIKTVGLADELKRALQPEEESVRSAFIFGSFASGRLTPESDIDIFIVGDLTLRRVVMLLKPVEVSREINPVVVPPDEFRERVQAGEHFFNAVLNSPKVYLVGDDNDLAELAGWRVPDRGGDLAG